MYYRCEDQGYRWLKTKWQPWFVQLILLSTKGWVLSCFENSTYSDFKLFMVWMPQISWIFSFIQVLSNFHKNDNWYYYISQLLCALWLDNLAGRILEWPIKILKSRVFLAKMFHNLSPNVLSFYNMPSKSFKLSFTFNCELKRANGLTTISNWLVLLLMCVRTLKLFCVIDWNRPRRYNC